jgi:hypothetical protein
MILELVELLIVADIPVVAAPRTRPVASAALGAL